MSNNTTKYVPLKGHMVAEQCTRDLWSYIPHPEDSLISIAAAMGEAMYSANAPATILFCDFFDEKIMNISFLFEKPADVSARLIIDKSNIADKEKTALKEEISYLFEQNEDAIRQDVNRLKDEIAFHQSFPLLHNNDGTYNAKHFEHIAGLKRDGKVISVYSRHGYEGVTAAILPKLAEAQQHPVEWEDKKLFKSGIRVVKVGENPADIIKDMQEDTKAGIDTQKILKTAKKVQEEHNLNPVPMNKMLEQWFRRAM